VDRHIELRFIRKAQIAYYISAMKPNLFQITAALIISCVAPGLHAQSPEKDSQQNSPKSSKITAISVTGTQKFPTDQIAAAGGIKIGDTVTAEQIQSAADRLSALGIFSRISFRYAAKGDAISLEFQVTEAPTYPISFDNFPWFADNEIGNAIRNQVGLFTGESPGEGTMVDQITSVLENLLDSRTIRGSVAHQLLAQVSDDRMIMQFRIDGASLKIQSVKFGDALAADSERLKDRIPDIKGQPYSRFAIELFENEQIRPLYAAKGFLRAQIGPPLAHLISDAANPAGTAVDIQIPIAPGSPYIWKGASWKGNMAFLSANLDEALQEKPGELADGMKIEASWRTIESEYGRRGYLDAKVTPQAQFDDVAHLVSHQVSIVEGPQYRMGEMVITGLSLEGEKRLRRYWQLAPGQIFNNIYFEGIAKELVKPSANIFGDLPLHYEVCGHWLRPNPELHTVDVLLDFK
jgi:outer membrane protein insertion porin family